MKQKIKNALLNPKKVIIIAIILAVILGFVITVIHQKTLNDLFSKTSTNSEILSGTYSKDASSQDLTLAFPVGGRIKSVFVKTGDVVKAGTMLASLDAENAIGAINQAKGAYEAAQTAYNKLVNGAYSPDVAVTQASVDTASTNLENAKQNLIRDLSTAYSSVNSAVLSNTNNLFSNAQTGNPQFGVAGTVQTNTQLVTDINSERVQINTTLTDWQNEISSMNENNLDAVVSDSTKNISSIKKYLTDLLNILTSNTQISSGGSQSTVATYQSAVTSAKATVDSAYMNITNDNQAIKSAKAVLDQAKASLTLKTSSARPEDLEIAKAQVQSTEGALQIAQGAYNNTIITAPVDGKIINVSITAGQIAIPNTPAIELLSQ